MTETSKTGAKQKLLFAAVAIVALVAVGIFIAKATVPPVLSPVDAEAMLRATASEDAPTLTASAQRSLLTGQVTLAISVSDGLRSAEPKFDSGPSLLEAWSHANEHRVVGQGPRKWIKVDQVGATVDTQMPDPSPSQTKLKLERDLYGMGLDLGKEGKVFFLPETLVSKKIVTQKQFLRPKNAALAVENGRLNGFAWKTPLERFPTTGFALIDGIFFKTFRGHRDFSEVKEQDLTESLSLATTYLLKASHEDGSYAYNYDPIDDKESPSYNLLRHAGTTYALLQLYQNQPQDEVLGAAKKHLDYLIQQVVDCPKSNVKANCLLEKKSLKLGANGLALIALAKYTELTGDQSHLEVMQGLARHIKEVQTNAGEFSVHKQSFPEGRAASFKSDYYPGEAILGLMRLYALDHDKVWLDTAKKAALWLIDVRDKGKSVTELDHDHWLLYGLNDLYVVDQDPKFVEHTVKISRSIIDAQHRTSDTIDLVGSWYDYRSTPAATRSEGLMAAHHLLTAAGKQKEAREALNSVKLAMSFQLSTQIWPETAMYLQNPMRALGGFRQSFSDYDVRIDYVQHNVSSILAYLDDLKTPNP